MITFKNPINQLKEMRDAFNIAKHAGTARKFAEIKNGGESNTYVSPKERDRKKKRKQIANQSRRQNRK